MSHSNLQVCQSIIAELISCRIRRLIVASIGLSIYLQACPEHDKKETKLMSR